MDVAHGEANAVARSSAHSNCAETSVLEFVSNAWNSHVGVTLLVQIGVARTPGPVSKTVSSAGAPTAQRLACAVSTVMVSWSPTWVRLWTQPIAGAVTVVAPGYGVQFDSAPPLRNTWT